MKKLPAAAQPTVSPYAHSLVNLETPVAPTPETTPFFSDFASTYYHPRSLMGLAPPQPILETASLSNAASSSAPPSIPQFTSFDNGAALFESRDAAEDLLDSDFRPWLEEADAPQAVQMLAGASDAWSGFAARYLEALRDELPKQSLWMWGIEPSGDRQFASLRQRRELAANRAQATAAFAAHASAYVPLAIPAALPAGLELQLGSLWHTSALLAASFESATMPSRMKSGQVPRVPVMGDWENVLGDGGRRRVLNLKTGVHRPQLPEPSGERDRRVAGSGAEEDAGQGALQEELDKTLDVDLFPHDTAGGASAGGRVLGRKAKTFARVETFRGCKLSPAALGMTSSRGMGAIVEWQVVVATAVTMLTLCSYASHPGLPQPITFPHIFSEFKASHGVVPMHTSLSTSSAVAAWLRAVAAPFGPAGSAMAFPGDVAGEEKEALRSTLLEVADAYVEDWESRDESEEEDE